MKKILIVCCVAISMLSFYSCKKKKDAAMERQEQIALFRSQLTQEDSVQVLRLCDDAMEQLKQRNIDQVIASLYEYVDSTKAVNPLSKATMNAYRKKFEMFPVLEYQRKYFSFQLEGCNDVKYEVIFATAEQTGTGEPAKTAFMFNPVKVDGTWKLCVKSVDDQMDASKI